MRLQYIASAAVLIEHHGVKVLCDPWLVDGAYGGAWFHNPPLSVVPEDFHDCQWCYVSHIHPDHACLSTIDRLSRSTVMLVGTYAEAFLASKLRALGFQVLELDHRTPFALGPEFAIQVIPADDCNPQACGKWIGCQIANPKERASYQIDTLAVFEGSGHIIVNANDCPYELAMGALERVKCVYGQPDLLCVGYAGAGPWPQCFPGVDQPLEAEKKQAQFLGQMQSFVEHLHPKRYLPFAGQYTLGGSLVDLNDLRGVPELEDLPDDPRMVRLNRMGWYDCETGQSEPFVPVPMEQKRAYRETLRDRRLDHESDPPVDMGEIVSGIGMDAQRALWRRCAARGFTSDSVLRINGIYVTFTEDYQLHVGMPTIDIRLDTRLFKRLLLRQAHWNNCEIASVLTFEREGPYDRGAAHHLSYFHI